MLLEWLHSYHNIIGVLGGLTSITMYAMMQWRRDFAKSFLYSGFNLLASSLMGISLWWSFNLASFVTNTCWWLISLYGVYRCLKYRLRGINDY